MKRIHPFSPRQFNVPEDLEDVDFLDAMADAFTHPDLLDFYRPDYGFLARIRDGQRIRGYWNRAMGRQDSLDVKSRGSR